MHEDKLVHGKANGFDRALWREPTVVQQCHMRREVWRDPAGQSGSRHCLCQRAVEQQQRIDIVERANHERPLATTIAAEAPGAIERDFERRRRDRIAGFACGINQVLRQIRMIAEAMQRNMEPLGRNKLSLRPVSSRSCPARRKMREASRGDGSKAKNSRWRRPWSPPNPGRPSCSDNGRVALP